MFCATDPLHRAAHIASSTNAVQIKRRFERNANTRNFENVRLVKKMLVFGQSAAIIVTDIVS